jgi:hypothetical protein
MMLELLLLRLNLYYLTYKNGHLESTSSREF